MMENRITCIMLSSLLVFKANRCLASLMVIAHHLRTRGLNSYSIRALTEIIAPPLPADAPLDEPVRFVPARTLPTM